EVAPLLLGGILIVESPEGSVSVRLTEVEAYHGPVDPGSHAYRGRTERNKVMFGEPGHLYTYFTYGMHTCANIVCSPADVGSGVLLRAGEVIDGLELARSRRITSRTDADLARGPARLVVATGITLADGGADVVSGSRVRLELGAPVATFAQGPRTGVAGPGGTDEFPWRFWIPGDPTVSPYKAAAKRVRR
ncbi:MAG TPA: DNA-3-methyladenine glycosylase, partial [Terrimesophilobacter sp.]|nr:DNA-3-methyladenine glycosylase [Terrimesophilobacter sp.]